MNKADLPKLVDLITALCSAFGKEVDRAILFGYEMALEDLPIAAVEIAVRRALKQCKFMPSGAELRELAGEVRDTDRAVIAFAALSKAVLRHGYYTSVTFDDRLINAAVNNLGGWEHVCMIESQDDFEKWFRKDFERVYLALCRTGASAEACRPLVGHCDRNNGFMGYTDAVKSPLLIATGLPAPRPGLVFDKTYRRSNEVPRIEFKKPPEEDVA